MAYIWIFSPEYRFTPYLCFLIIPFWCSCSFPIAIFNFILWHFIFLLIHWLICYVKFGTTFCLLCLPLRQLIMCFPALLLPHHSWIYSELLCFDDRFATSERQWIEAQVENAKQQAVLSILKAQVSSDEAHIHRDIHSLRYMLCYYYWFIDHDSYQFPALYHIHKLYA